MKTWGTKMFAGSVDKPEDLIYKIAQIQVSLLSEKDFQRFLRDEYPRTSAHFNAWHSRYATWSLDRIAQIGLFGAVDDNPAVLDYTLLRIKPKPHQVLNLQDVQKGLEQIEGMRLIDIVPYVLEGEGFKKVCKMYER